MHELGHGLGTMNLTLCPAVQESYHIQGATAVGAVTRLGLQDSVPGSRNPWILHGFDS